MPAPAAPTALSLTAAGSGYGYGTLAWTHAGTTKYQVLYKRPYDDEWKNLRLRNSAVFGASSPYDMEVPLTDSISYSVRAINSAGEASTGTTPVTFTGSVDGTWLLPFANDEITDTEVSWIGASSTTWDNERDGTLLTIPTREAEVNMTTGVLHLGKGTVEGLLLTRHSVTADEWLGRLERLIKNQKKNRWVWYATPRWMAKVELTGPFSRSTTVAGGRAYTVSVGIRELPTSYGL